MDRQQALDWLHASLCRRDTPEAVAGAILAALPADADLDLRQRLQRAAASSTRRQWGWSAMSDEFRAPDPMDRQVAKAAELAGLFLGKGLESDDPDALEDFVEAFSGLIGRAPGGKDFKGDRLDSAGRAEALPGLSRRRYNKLFRLAGRLEDRLRRLHAAEERYGLLLVGKAGLSRDLRPDQTGGHVPTLAFVAYLSARMKLRSEFTIDGQQRPFDENAQALLALCEGDPDTRWEAVAHVFPRADVLARLPDEAKGRLLGRWFGILELTACHLERIAERTKVDVSTMVVRQGNDSSSWNLLAGAWNRSRDNWLSLAESLGLHALLDVMLPGKVMRLMAGDVVAWHGSAGGSIHPDTKVWAELPKPWAVVNGEAECGKALVVAACARNGVDPVKSGWAAARERTEVAAYRPTPELVHGVTVHNPYLADVLRRMGAFSGKPVGAPLA